MEAPPPNPPLVFRMSAGVLHVLAEFPKQHCDLLLGFTQTYLDSLRKVYGRRLVAFAVFDVVSFRSRVPQVNSAT